VPFEDQADAGTRFTPRQTLWPTCDEYLERLFQAIAPPRSTSRVTIRCSAPGCARKSIPTQIATDRYFFEAPIRPRRRGHASSLEVPTTCDLAGSSACATIQQIFASAEMDDLRQLRILVDCAIDDLRSRRPHPTGCACGTCQGRPSADQLTMARRQGTRFEATLAADEAPPFVVRRVDRVPGPLRLGQHRPLFVGPRLTGARRQQAQLLTRDGVFLAGATERHARHWATSRARRLGGTVTLVETHQGGRPHFHIELPPGSPVHRSGHIFWGSPPAGQFFEFDNL
jgi:hypothetical protein